MFISLLYCSSNRNWSKTGAAVQNPSSLRGGGILIRQVILGVPDCEDKGKTLEFVWMG